MRRSNFEDAVAPFSAAAAAAAAGLVENCRRAEVLIVLLGARHREKKRRAETLRRARFYVRSVAVARTNAIDIAAADCDCDEWRQNRSQLINVRLACGSPAGRAGAGASNAGKRSARGFILASGGRKLICLKTSHAPLFEGIPSVVAAGLNKMRPIMGSQP